MALSLDWISATDSRSCTAPLREGKEGRPGGGGRAPAGGRSPVQARNYPTATWPYWGGAACAAHPQTPGVLAPCRRAAETRTFRRSGGQGELPGNCRAVDENGTVFGWAGAVIRRSTVRAAGGLLPILQGGGCLLDCGGADHLADFIAHRSTRWRSLCTGLLPPCYRGRNSRSHTRNR